MTPEEAIRTIVKNSMPLVCDFGKVTRVDETTFLCEIDIEGKSPVGDVRLFCGDYNSDAKGGGIVVIPEVGSQVLVIFFSKTVAFMLQCSKAKKIVFNGGELGGLVKIEELIKKINQLEDKLKNHQHGYIPYPGGVASPTPVATTPATTAVPPDMTLQFENTKQEEIEDENVKH